MNFYFYLVDRYYSWEQCYIDYGFDYYYRGNRDRDDFFYEDRNYDGWSYDYENRRDSSRDGKWCLF